MSYESALSVATLPLVTYPLTQSSYEYLMRLKDLGAIEGELGQMKANPALLPLIDALHAVLAGGEVRVTVVHRGNPDVVRELEAQLAQSTLEANEVNKKSGHHVTLAIP